MGMIGDLLYPDNPNLAREANADQYKLARLNALHNQLVTIYRELANDIRTFDSDLMSLLVLHYHLVYAEEDLENLPDTRIPQITDSLANKIEEAGFAALSVNLAYNGIKAIYNRIANVLKEGGSYRANIEGGELNEEGVANLSEDLAPEIESVAGQSDLLSSANIDLLTNTELETTQIDNYAADLGEIAEDLSTATTEVGEGVSEVAEAAEIGTEAATATMEGVEAATEVATALEVAGAASAAASGAAIVLIPAIIIITVVAAIFEAIEAAKTHEKLEETLHHLRKMLDQSERSLNALKKATKSLLQSGRADIKAYNKILYSLYQLEGNQIYNQSFGTDGFDSFSSAIDGITVDNASGLQGYKQAVQSDLTPAKEFIFKHAKNTATMTTAIRMIRSKVRAHGEDSITPNYLKKVADVLALSPKQVTNYNEFRQVLNGIASVLAPYHEQIRQETPPDSTHPVKPTAPKFGKFDPTFRPQPEHFQVPKINYKHTGIQRCK